VRGIHDLHVWSISTGKESLSVHVEVADGVNRDSILSEINELLSQEFGIDHATLQVETEAQRKKEKNHFHS
ncbi:MAG: cation transporter, partial [Candidatus Omnitrophica bacterium]|nr:cation transporter [Candidatus Omnitrophota bacterium]